jgi:hypothetical protein
VRGPNSQATSQISRLPPRVVRAFPKQIRQIAKSIVEFGFTNPLLVDEDGEVIAGEGRYRAALLLGIEMVPVIIIAGLSPAKRRALAIADNRIAQNAGWDRTRLAIEIPELSDLLSAEGLDVSVLGFEPVEIEHLPRFERTAPPRNDDAIDPAWGEAPTVTRPGDLWVLGNHKFLCGDVRGADLTCLMTGCPADMAFLDPHAGVGTALVAELKKAGLSGRHTRSEHPCNKITPGTMEIGGIWMCARALQSLLALSIARLIGRRARIDAANLPR